MIILMADIIGSSAHKGQALMASFRKSVERVNRQASKDILSPLTITLGDEFQGVVKSTEAAFRVIFMTEQLLRQEGNPYRLRFAVHEGKIDTKINRERAHEMLGPGLAEARHELTAMKSSRHRFSVVLADQSRAGQLNLAMNVYQGIVDRWTPRQLKVVLAFEQKHNYRDVAKVVKRDPTVIWRRKRSLMIEEYNDIKKLVMLTANPAWKAA
jgi:hypothetical protein